MRFKVLLCVCLLNTVQLVCSTEILVPLGSSVVLPCTFSSGNQTLNITWSLRGSVIASSEHTEPGYYLDTSHLLNGSVPLAVLNVTPHQQGEYQCTVTNNETNTDTNTEADFSSNVTLTVLSSPSVSVGSTEVVLGQESTVECWAKAFSPPHIRFSWMREGRTFRTPVEVKGNLTDDGLYQAVSQLVFVPEPGDQNITYSCVVQHQALENPLVQEFKTSINILPKVSVTVLPGSSGSSPLTLACDISGFYPQNLSVVWVQRGSVLPEVPHTYLNSDGTYRTRRFYTLSVEERERRGTVQCLAQQPHVLHPATGSVNLTTADPHVRELVLTKSAKASVAMMIISLILVLLLCFGFSWKRRDEKQKCLNVSAIILPPRVVVGRKGRVTISIEGRRADQVQTAWFLNDVPIVDTSYTGEKSVCPGYSHTPRISRTSLVSEKGFLLPAVAPGYYKLHTRPAPRSSGPIKQLLSSFTFIPNLSVHKGAVFKCQISYRGKDKIVMEKVSEKFTVLAPPEVSEIQLSEPNEDTGVVTLTVKASHFHPDIITFRWFCEGGELCPVAAPPALAAPRPDAQGFFSARSQCRLPKTELDTGHTTVWVTVHHLSLKQPITRKTKGFIKKPIMSDITCTSSQEGPPTFTCDITGFYPPHLSVQWLRRGRRSEEALEEADKTEHRLQGVSEVWGPIQTQLRSFRATAVLKEVEEEVKEVLEGGEVVCRLEHCSLQQPIERVWRRTHFVSPSIPPSLTVLWRTDGMGTFSLRLTGGVPRPKMVWAAGGSILTQLISRERETVTESGERELLSVCTLVKSTGPQGNQPHRQTRRDGHNFLQTEAEDEVDTSGHDQLSETLEDNWTQRPDCGETDLESSYINLVNLRKEGGRGERESLRVSVEITHPALGLPIYRTWTESEEDVST